MRAFRLHVTPGLAKPDLPSATPATDLLLMVRTIQEDLKSHGGDWTRPGFQALALHRFGNWRMGISWRPARLPFSLMYNALFAFVRNVYGIEVPYSARIGRGVIIEHQGNIVVHGNAIVGTGSTLRQGVTLGNRYLDKPTEAPTIGRNVNIGAGAKILGDVVVGDGAQIGANAVVTQDVRAGSSVGGVPAVELNAPTSRRSVRGVG